MLHIFTRDLRIEDNTALEYISHNISFGVPNDNIYLVFFYDPQQNNIHAIRFMLETLYELITQCKLSIINGNYKDGLDIILNDNPNIKTVTLIKDYTPYAIIREENVRKLCEFYGVKLMLFDDYFTFPEPQKKYKIFTPFYKSVIDKNVQKPRYSFKKRLKQLKQLNSNNFISLEQISNMVKQYNNIIIKNIINNNSKYLIKTLIHGGRSEMIKRLKKIKNWSQKFNESTTKMSAYIKFGCISPREFYWKMKHNINIIREFVWRDFYLRQMKWGFDQRFNQGFNQGFNQRFNQTWDVQKITKLDNIPEFIYNICKLLEYTGYINNRMRLIVADYFNKKMGLHWVIGEHYFSMYLIDYDRSSNVGNWIWSWKQPIWKQMNYALQEKKYGKVKL